MSTEYGLTMEAGGGVQVLALGRRVHRGRILRVVNTYVQKVGRDGDHRPAEKALWDDILSEENCILSGNFNAPA